MSADRTEPYAHREDAGVPPVAVCEERAAEAQQAAQETDLTNVRDLYTRSALRWSELAHQKDGRL
jgi:hypothetical protein